MISIIIPVYNCEQSISDCLDSLLCQTYKDIEIIVVDDGSTDKSAAVVNNICLQYPNVFLLHKRNGGVSSARNFGIECANGEHLMFVDADDIILNNHYIEEFAQRRDSDYVVSGLTNRKYLQNGEHTDLESRLEEAIGNEAQSLPYAFFVNGFVHTSCSKLYKKVIIDQNSIRFPKVRLSEDSFFNVEYLKHINMWELLNGTGYCYIHRHSGENATAKYNPSDIDAYIRLYDAMCELPVSEAIVDKTLYAQFLAICLRCLRSQQLSYLEKKSEIRRILQKPNVRIVLRRTRTTTGEWITGLIVSTGSLLLYKLWGELIKLKSK